jgi:hypothetical protein
MKSEPGEKSEVEGEDGIFGCEYLWVSRAALDKSCVIETSDQLKRALMKSRCGTGSPMIVQSPTDLSMSSLSHTSKKYFANTSSETGSPLIRILSLTAQKMR